MKSRTETMKFKARGDISQCDVYSGPSNALPPRCGPRLNSFWFSRLVYGVTQADLGLVNSPASAKGIAGITVQVFCYRVGGGGDLRPILEGHGSLPSGFPERLDVRN